MGEKECGICHICKGKIKYVQEPRCIKCGKGLEVKGKDKKCRDCQSRTHKYNRGRALYEYKDVAAAIYRFKYQNRREYAAFFGEEMAKMLHTEIREWNVEALIPVPLHKKRRNKRGFNQSELLARELGKRLSIPVCSKLVIRCRNTTPQKCLNAIERQNNLKKAFKIIGNDVKLKKVIIVDDIYTTGETIDQISEALIDAGVKEVYFLTLAIGAGL